MKKTFEEYLCEKRYDSIGTHEVEVEIEGKFDKPLIYDGVEYESYFIVADLRINFSVNDDSNYDRNTGYGPCFTRKTNDMSGKAKSVSLFTKDNVEKEVAFPINNNELATLIKTKINDRLTAEEEEFEAHESECRNPKDND